MAGVTVGLTNGTTNSNSLPVSIQQPRTLAGSSYLYSIRTIRSIIWRPLTTLMHGDIHSRAWICASHLVLRSWSSKRRAIFTGTFEVGPCVPQQSELDNWVSSRENCFNYATNRRVGHYSHPGGPNDYSPFTCSTFEAKLASQGIVRTTADGDGCSPSGTVIALVLSLTKYNYGVGIDTYHFYRRNADGTWSHKPGKRPATDRDSSKDIITDPYMADRRRRSTDGRTFPGYTVFCGYYCVPCDFEMPAPPPGAPLPYSGAPSLRAELIFESAFENPSWLIDDAGIQQSIWTWHLREE